MKNNVVREQKFDTFQSFWEQINPLGEIGEKLSGFIFRGENSDKYKLLPSVLRDGYVKQNEPNQVYHEIDLLSQFYREANNYGLRVPNSQILRGSTPETVMGYGLFWISDEFEETAALAQHYGIKTRLLDWTRDVFSAFYFATHDLLVENDHNRDTKCFVIYALNFEFLIRHINSWDFHKRGISIPKPLPLKFVVPHYLDIPNAYAQNGVLSYSEVDISPHNSKSWIINTTPLDVRLQELVDDEESCYKLPDKEILLYKFYLPKSEAKNMFAYISRFNYSHSKLFPGYAGIKKTLDERNIFEAICDGQ